MEADPGRFVGRVFNAKKGDNEMTAKKRRAYYCVLCRIRCHPPKKDRAVMCPSCLMRAYTPRKNDSPEAVERLKKERAIWIKTKAKPWLSARGA